MKKKRSAHLCNVQMPRGLLIALLPCLVASTSTASLVTWSAVQGISGNTDIANPSGIVEAWNFGHAGVNLNVDVGGTNVIFAPRQSPFDNSTTSTDFYQGGAVDADFHAVLDSFAWSDAGSNPSGIETLSFTGLTGGGVYAVQVFLSDNRDTFAWNVGLEIGGTTTTIYTNSSNSNFVTGTVTLGAAETSFDLAFEGLASGPGGTSNQDDVPLVNAVTLSTLSAVPEASEALVVLLGMTGLLGVRRRRR